MAEFVELWEQRHEVLELFFDKAGKAEETRFNELQMATRIQQVYRGSVVRAWLTRRSEGARQIQRTFRAFLARKEVTKRVALKAKLERIKFFNKAAVQIQKIWRGFYSRKYTHSYYARKAYIQAVVTKGEKMREELEANLQRQIEDSAARAIETEAAEFRKLAANLHHLISTEGIPGIYNSPYQQDCIPTAFNVPVETHLRETYKDFMPSRSKMSSSAGQRGNRSSSGGGSTQGGSIRPKTVGDTSDPARARSVQEQYRNVRLGLRGPFKYPEVVAEIKNRRPNTSIQAESNYNIVNEATWLEYKYSKIARIQYPDFIGTVKPKPEYVRSISQGTRYGVKVPRSRDDSNKEGRVSELPFHLAFSGNKLFEDDSLPINATQLPKLA